LPWRGQNGALGLPPFYWHFLHGWRFPAATGRDFLQTLLRLCHAQVQLRFGLVDLLRQQVARLVQRLLLDF